HAGLVINATFSGIYNVAQKAEVTTAIAYYQNTFSDNMTLNIRFLNSGLGLGSTSQFLYKVNYADYLTALRLDATTANDATALANIPNGTGALPAAGQNAPVPGTGNQLIINRANAAAVGLNVGTQSNGITTWDADIDLNLALMSTNHASPTAGQYDERSVAMHEINEVLGTSSNLGRIDAFFAGSSSAIDLFRYDAAGNRSFTTLGDDAYLALDSASKLVRFNQDARGDYGDFWSNNGGGNFGANPTYQIQDAFSASGKAAEMGVENAMLDVIGYNFKSQVNSVPEPASLPLVLAALGLAGLTARRRQL
ncbi:NF038122 family metalloprotease, partial [Roseateles sp. GG27B]